MEVERLIAQILVRHNAEPGGLMPALQEIQEDLGYIPRESLPAIAGAFNVSSAEVHGVVSFYHDFRYQPLGRHVVQVCQAESCQACGSRELTAHAEQCLGVSLGETRADGAVSLEPVYCLGNCACSPAIAIDQRSHAGVTVDRFDQLTAALLGEGES